MPLLLATATRDSFSSSAAGHGAPAAEASMAKRRPQADQNVRAPKPTIDRWVAFPYRGEELSFGG